MLGDEHAASGGSPDGNLLNCWQSLKLEEPQREDETSLSVTAAKAEKIFEMAHGASLNASLLKWVFSNEDANSVTLNDYPERE